MDRLAQVVELMREISRHGDPQQLVAAYTRIVSKMIPNAGIIAVSRRGLAPPKYKVTRASAWEHHPDPWRNPHLLPVHDRGILGDLLYAQQPRIIDDLILPEDDPCRELFRGARSIAVVPQYDETVALNMVVILQHESGKFDVDRFPDFVWQSNLFGRTTNNLVLHRQLKEAYDALDREMKIVAEIQQSLLPEHLPTCGGLELAAHYQASRNAGGDYYDFFQLRDDSMGILVADVSGHGTPAAVLMAIMHAIAHTNARSAPCPADWMTSVNRELCERYTRSSGTFVTAFYAVWNPATRTLRYTSAGHNPPRLKRGDTILSLEDAQGLPLGIDPEWTFTDATATLLVGDVLALYTDGITEAMNAQRQLLGTDALDDALRVTRGNASNHLDAVLRAVNTHTNGTAMNDDSTLVVARVT